MNEDELLRRRLSQQRLIGTPFARPEEVVEWLGAVQAQDYPGAKWALGQRVRNATDAVVEEALQEGRILRTHVLRPTWHFVTPADIRWMLELTAPRVIARLAPYDRALELDDAVYARSNAAIAKALRGGRHLTRAELSAVLAKAGVPATGQRLAHVVSRAELDAVVCSGPRRGKQLTYALLDERAPGAKSRPRDEALAELTRRYLTSHGPATAQDFGWWSGLTQADVKAGLHTASPRPASEVVDGKTYWFYPSRSNATLAIPTVHLLPNYDEYLIAFKDRSAAMDPRAEIPQPQGAVSDPHLVVLNGRVVGRWRAAAAKKEPTLEANLLVKLDPAERRALEAAAERYARFLGRPVRLGSPGRVPR